MSPAPVVSPRVPSLHLFISSSHLRVVGSPGWIVPSHNCPASLASRVYAAGLRDGLVELDGAGEVEGRTGKASFGIFVPVALTKSSQSTLLTRPALLRTR